MRILSFILLFYLTACASTMAHQDPPIPALPRGTIDVMVIDTGIDEEHPYLKPYIDTERSPDHGVRDDNTLTEFQRGHGTHITGLILYGRSIDDRQPHGLCKEIRIINCSKLVGNPESCMAEALRLGVKYINYAGIGTGFIQAEYDLMKQLVSRGVTIVTAAGNEGKNLSKNSFYPASYNIPGVYVVGNGLSQSERAGSSNFGPGLTWEDGFMVLSTYPGGKFEFMTGTSQSSALRMHKLLMYRCGTLHPGGFDFYVPTVQPYRGGKNGKLGTEPIIFGR